MQKSKQK